MTPSVQKIQRLTAIAVVCYFAAFTAICWILDLAFPGKLIAQTRVQVAFDAGVVTGLFTIFCSAILWRSHRRLAILGLGACLLWTVWILLPRI
jgi:hypothetical protein